jgi:hypothetical protein
MKKIATLEERTSKIPSNHDIERMISECTPDQLRTAIDHIDRYLRDNKDFLTDHQYSRWIGRRNCATTTLQAKTEQTNSKQDKPYTLKNPQY